MNAVAVPVIQQPFAHAFFDGLVERSAIRAVNAEWPETGWINHSHAHSQKRGCSVWEAFGPETRRMILALNRDEFVKELAETFNIPGLQADPLLYGGGLHEAFRGGFLGIHADFNIHPQTHLVRRLNLLLFLNEEWWAEWGGELELWSTERVWVRIRPTAGMCVVFATTDRSFHGHPQPLNCPADRSRRSLALYYYSPQMPGEWIRKHSTLYRGDEAGWFKESD